MPLGNAPLIHTWEIMKANTQSRVTQRDVANALGVEVTTVSKALRNHPAVAAKTKERVLSKAAELGYRRDPMLSALANHRRGLQALPRQAAIAWVHNHPRAINMEVFPGYPEYLAGARQRAEKLGYGLESFYIDGSKLTAERLDRMLQARGIQCVVVAPQPTASGTLVLSWDRLCGVAIGYTLSSPRLNLVTNDHFLTMSDLLQRLRERGYARIGCYLSNAENERMGRRASSAFMAYSKECRVHVKMFEYFKDQDFIRWVDVRRLDAVIAPGELAWQALQSANRTPPETIGLAGYALAEDETHVTGMSHNNRRIGELAVDFLCRAFEQGDFGLPDHPVRVLVPPVWLENRTLCGSGMNCLPTTLATSD